MKWGMKVVRERDGWITDGWTDRLNRLVYISRGKILLQCPCVGWKARKTSGHSVLDDGSLRREANDDIHFKAEGLEAF